MKPRSLSWVLMLFLAGLLSSGCASGPEVLYHEHFAPLASGVDCPSGPHGDLPPACFGWKAHSGIDGRPVSHVHPLRRASVIPISGPDGLPGRAFVYLASERRIPNQDILFWTEESHIDRGRFKHIAFGWSQFDDLRVSHRLAIRIAGPEEDLWYASSEVFRHPALPGVETPFGENRLPFDPLGFYWIPFTFEEQADPARPFDVSGLPVARFLPQGDITAFGIYMEMNTDTYTDASGRFDDFHIIATPR